MSRKNRKKHKEFISEDDKLKRTYKYYKKKEARKYGRESK